VSRLFPDRVVVGLAPAALGYARLQGVSRPRIVEKRVLDCDPQFGPQPWQGAVAALAQLAGALKSARTSVTVVLSNHFVRYALVPRNDGLDRGAENLAFARYCLGKIYGERSKAWEVRLGDGTTGSTRVASAIDAELLQAVRACFAPDGKAKLVSVQPYLMSAFNRWRSVAGGKSAWLLLVEPRRACLARLETGHWNAVRNTRGDFEGPDEWAEMLDRERHLMAAAAAEGEIFVHAPHRAKVEDVEAGSWRFKALTLPELAGYSPIEDARLDMALSAL